jgi:NADH-quinone oxidoreductase subunit L
LVLLAIPSVLIGYFTIDGLLYGSFFADAIFVDTLKHPAMLEIADIFHGPMAMAAHGLQTAPFWLALAGVAAAYYMYMVNPAVPAAFARMFAPIIKVMENKYYMDWFNENVLARGARMLGTGLWKGGDQGVIEGGIVNASWKLVGFISSLVRKAQSGFIYHYAFVMILGMFALVTVFVWLAK